jgi:hypothetical protein
MRPAIQQLRLALSNLGFSNLPHRAPHLNLKCISKGITLIIPSVMLADHLKGRDVCQQILTTQPVVFIDCQTVLDNVTEQQVDSDIPISKILDLPLQFFDMNSSVFMIVNILNIFQKASLQNTQALGPRVRFFRVMGQIFLFVMNPFEQRWTHVQWVVMGPVLVLAFLRWGRVDLPI